MFLIKRTGTDLQYHLARSAYHHFCKQAQKNFNMETIDKLLKKPRGQKYLDIFRMYKSSSAHPCSIDLSVFLPYSKTLFEKECLVGAEPGTTSMEPVEPEQFGRLLDNVSFDEVMDVMEKFTSKAKSATGMSPKDLKEIGEYLAPYLAKIFSTVLEGRALLPAVWLESAMVFMHKSGDKQEPGNYRTLFIQSPFLKTFMAVVRNRLSKLAEANGILPSEQFGFRDGLSCTSAVSIFYESVRTRLEGGVKTFVAFLDLKKAFDKIDRRLLFKKLVSLGIPGGFTDIIDYIYSNIRVSIKNDGALSEEFLTSSGVPQGCPLSPLMYIIFASDMKNWLKHRGIFLHETNVKFIQYADDIALLADSDDDLQLGLNHIGIYLKENHLEVNVAKTKVMIFHRGRPKSYNFAMDGESIEIVKSFKYLGFNLSPQLSWTNHVKRMVSKARARIGYMYANLPIREVPLDMAINLFKIYILGLFQFGLPIWRTKCATAAWDQLDATFTKYLKRYLGVPRYACNAITYHLTGSIPFSTFMKRRISQSISVLRFPGEFHGMMLPCLIYPNSLEDEEYNNNERVPSWFWLSRSFEKLPTNGRYRSMLCKDLFDHRHQDLCRNDCFHIQCDECECKYCNQLCTHYHERFCPEMT